MAICGAIGLVVWLSTTEAEISYWSVSVYLAFILAMGKYWYSGSDPRGYFEPDGERSASEDEPQQ